jgi:hypothetical protein
VRRWWGGKREAEVQVKEFFVPLLLWSFASSGQRHRVDVWFGFAAKKQRDKGSKNSWERGRMCSTRWGWGGITVGGISGW